MTADHATGFDDDAILPPDPDGLEVLHEREYRVRAYRMDHPEGSRMVVRGAVRDQKPAGLYLADDPDPLTIHHMQLELQVSWPAIEIVDAAVLFETHPHGSCVSIADAYRSLIGTSIGRGFTHEVRRRFGGPRGCTHTTALLLAMAPVAVQSIWSMRQVDDRRAGKPFRPPNDLSAEERRRWFAGNVNTCHVWAEGGTHARAVLTGADVPLPIPIRRRFEQLGVER